jgi:toxin YhaV
MTDLKLNGWTIYLHPQFILALRALIAEVRNAREADPENYTKKSAFKLLAATRKMAFTDIPAAPADPKFRQGDTLGDNYKNWFRGKYLQQFRLFFRYDEKKKIIVLAWFNDNDTKRAYGSKTDAYKTFAKMLKAGNPPDDWDTLLKTSKEASNAAEDIKALAGQ